MNNHASEYIIITGNNQKVIFQSVNYSGNEVSFYSSHITTTTSITNIQFYFDHLDKIERNSGLKSSILRFMHFCMLKENNIRTLYLL